MLRLRAGRPAEVSPWAVSDVRVVRSGGRQRGARRSTLTRGGGRVFRELESSTHLIIVLVVLLLCGAKRIPELARGLWLPSASSRKGGGRRGSGTRRGRLPPRGAKPTLASSHAGLIHPSECVEGRFSEIPPCNMPSPLHTRACHISCSGASESLDCRRTMRRTGREYCDRTAWWTAWREACVGMGSRRPVGHKQGRRNDTRKARHAPPGEDR